VFDPLPAWRERWAGGADAHGEVGIVGVVEQFVFALA
jgi:hypothetical protein